MCTSPITVYSCGHTKPDHIIEFCYTDYEDDCGQVHPRFERLGRRCPHCTRRAHNELERKAGIPAHGPHDEDASSSSARLSVSPRSSSPSSPKGEPVTSTSFASTESAAKMYCQQLLYPATTEKCVVATTAPLEFSRASARCGHGSAIGNCIPSKQGEMEKNKIPGLDFRL